MQKDGAYHVAALDQGQPVRLSEDYFIATDKANPPEVSPSTGRPAIIAPAPSRKSRSA